MISLFVLRLVPRGSDLIPGSVGSVPRRLEESKETGVSWHTTLLAKSSVLYLCEGDEAGGGVLLCQEVRRKPVERAAHA